MKGLIFHLTLLSTGVGIRSEITAWRICSGIYEAGSYDVVAMMQVFDHLPDPRQTLASHVVFCGMMGYDYINVNGSSFCARVFAGGYRLIAPNHLLFSPLIEIVSSEFGLSWKSSNSPTGIPPTVTCWKL